ncbi:hypothetical protein QQ045_014084 [Rhodiola kirilowii]
MDGLVEKSLPDASKSADRKSTLEEVIDQLQHNHVGVGEGSVQLPDHLICSILLKLPNESLIRFLALSKLWNEAITSRRFCVDRKITSPELEVTNIIYIRYDFMTYTFQLYGHKIGGIGCQQPQSAIEVSRPIHYHLNSECSYVCFTASDGLLGVVCKKRYDAPYSHYILIWNPYTGQQKDVPLPGRRHGMARCMIEGFGYDTSSNDYKIVLIEFNDSTAAEYATRIMVRALKSNEWKTLYYYVSSDSSDPKQFSIYTFDSVTVDRDIWWIARYKHDESLVLMKFSLREEELSTMSLPRQTNPSRPGCCTRFWLSRHNKSLYLINMGMDSKIYIWRLMKEGNRTVWELALGIPTTKRMQPVGFTSNGTFIMRTHLGKTFYAYDLGQNSIVTFTLDESNYPSTSSSKDTFLLDVETLISP